MAWKEHSDSLDEKLKKNADNNEGGDDLLQAEQAAEESHAGEGNKRYVWDAEARMKAAKDRREVAVASRSVRDA